MFERHFVAYGVRIGLRVDCSALLDALERDPARMSLPVGWRPVGDDEPDGPVSVRYELLTSAPGGASPSYRVYAGRNLVADVRGLSDAGWALAAHAEPFVAERAPDHLFVHAGVVGWEGRAIVMPGASFAGKTTLVAGLARGGCDVLLRRVRGARPRRARTPVRPSAGDPRRLDRVDAPRAGRGSGRRDRDDAAAHRAGARDLVPARRTMETAPLECRPDAARPDAPHRRRARESRALHADSEAGGQPWPGVRRSARRGPRAGGRGSQTPLTIYTVRAATPGNPPMYPRQSATTHTEQLGDEASVYDWARGQVHALNPTAACVWRQCDGATTPWARWRRRCARRWGPPRPRRSLT